MTDVDTSVAQAGLANGKSHASGHFVSESSGSQATSTHPAEHGIPDPLLSDAFGPSSSLKAISSGDSTGKGKQAATDSATTYLNSDYHKATSSLTPIDESPTDAAFSYSYQDSYRSSANGYAHQSSSHRTSDHVRIDSPDMDEVPYSPTTYPPISEEDSEAKRVQQNLERWAAEERQRRKAQRSSKLLANRNSVAAGTGGLAQRLSILRTSAQTNNNNLGAGPSSERLADGPGASPSMPYDPRLGAADRRGSGSSSAAAGQGLHRSASSSSFDSSQSLGSLTSDDPRPNRRLPPIGSRVSSATHARNTSSGSGGSLKGLGTTANGSARNPFRDPSDGGAPEVTLEKRASLKPQPTASRPIVTVGRASSIQRRALESGYNSKGKGKGRSMPTIVATDTEAEAEAEAEMGRISSRVDDENPFASSEDRQPRARTESSTMIHEGGLDEEVALEMAGRAQAELNSGDIGESSLSTDQPIRPPPGRTSTSSSKFRELGITEGDDWIETMGRSLGKGRSRKMRIAPHADGDETAHEPRKPWWTELLCGCSRDEDDDEQNVDQVMHSMSKRTRASSKPRPRRRRQAPPTIVPLSASEDDDTQDDAPVQRRQSPPLMDVDAESSDGSIVEIEQELSLTARVEDEEEDGNGLFDEAVGVNAGDSAHGRADRLDADEEDIGDIEEPDASYDSEEEEENVLCDGILGDEHNDADDENELELVDEEDDNDAVLQRVASQAVAAAASSDGERHTRKANTRSEASRGGRHAELEKTIAWLLDPVKHLEVRDKQFADFVDPKFRNTSDVPKSTGKLFLRRRAEKFVLLYNQYRIVANLSEVDEHLLRVFELFITDLMNCFDHPKEVPGWNPFAAFADLVEAGAVVRTPEVVRACSRLTLGADWPKFTDADRARVGAELTARLTLLHHWRMAEVNDLLVSWDGKLENRSTCGLCGTDAWEIYLLTVPLALLEHGTKYIDKETPSDTSSGSEHSAEDDSDHDLDDLDEDQHEQRSEASERDDDFDLDPMLNYVPQVFRDLEEPPRPPTRGMALSQNLLKNYGPNAHLLRVVSLDEFGSADQENAQFKVCPDCGFRFDGGTIDPSSRFWRTIERAICVAREQINAVQEVIDLPGA